MAIPSIGFGEGASLGLGGGDIRSQDTISFGFNTGPFSTGGSTQNNVFLVLAGAAIAGIIVWLLLSHSSR